MDFYRPWWLFDNEDNNLCDPATITQSPQTTSVGLIGSIERIPSGRKIHTMHLTARKYRPK